MSYAIRIHETGGPDVLKYEKITVPAPGPGEILIRHTAIGLNFIDVYHRSGLYPLPLPFTPGTEGAGVVEALGEGVAALKKGDRVAYAGGLGSYAEQRIMPANRVVKIPDGISDEIAAASMVKGMTAEYLLNRTYKVKAGETILFHAIAGGVGLIACQWAKALGATVIGTAGSAEKIAIAKEYGCDHVINYKTEDFVARVKEITNGKGVPVVYDSVGRDTFIGSLDCLRPRGLMVSFGNASGPVEAFSPGTLSTKGSLFLTRPSLWHYTSDDAEYAASAKALFDMIRSGRVEIKIDRRYELKNAAQAQRDLESRKTTGSSILYLS
ncbi:MAG: quinone oxidoreductase [Alphaproteobacteria bacterium PRO2]|nr:quinone oxidoreductase [Alphaproteobacteria bacterium PRO2]